MTQEPYCHPAIDEITLPDVMHALSDPLRLSILRTLTDGSSSGQEINWGDFCGTVAPSTLSHHMKVLRNAGLILNRRDGTRCLVSLRPEFDHGFPGLLDKILEFAPACTKSAEAATKDAVQAQELTS